MHHRPVADWVKLGLEPADGGKFSNTAAEAFVMVPQGIEGPKFLVTRNFLSIMDYNLSHSYAVAVGHLGDRISGGSGIQAGWPDVNFDLSFAERVEMQKRLSASGFETGGADGRFGARTYEAVLGFQRKVGAPLDGTPSRKVLMLLRKGS